MKRAYLLLAPLLCAGCSSGETTEQFVKSVESGRIGLDTDVWIEMKNLAGEWEKVGLIFGYDGDFEECEKAIAGLKRVNYAREYRCVIAQRP